ncbi:N-glycosylase/DNA lyase [Leptotrichia sp.]|uniref:N-glycosylase/DNA lyase n=1 Tax=Leptotrichia sp. TaxID=104608 RepID=UPI0017DC358D|nr:N-glycosylase/DNA lyase [Leptotrichia sp.]MBB1534798.1 N-glycosylase/DNA lyase [Leptotrichia sp.]
MGDKNLKNQNLENQEFESKINKELNEKILGIYEKIKKDISKAISGYKKAWKGTEKEIFAEMAFCILTPQSKAKNAWQAITTLVENNLLYEGSAEEIVEYLNIVRFKNNKSRYLVEFRDLMTEDGKLQPKKILESKGNTFEKRKWILKNVKGMGLKEANHVLRNLGFGEEIAILDRHILRNLQRLNVIEEIPKTLTEKKYYEIEEAMKKYSEYSGIKMDELDLVLWYKEAGEVFK